MLVVTLGAGVAGLQPAGAAPLRVEHRPGGAVARFGVGQVEIVDAEGGARVALTPVRDARYVPGAPALPLVPVVLEVPVGQTAVGVVARYEEVEVASGLEVAAAPRPAPSGAEVVPAAPERPALFAGAEPYPAQVARLAGEGFARGHRLVTVELAPLRWVPDGGRLLLATELEIELQLATATDRPLARHRTIPRAEARYAGALAAAIGAPPPAAPLDEPDFPERFVPSFRPSIDGSPVEYVILTNDAMLPEFQALADWRTRMGLQAVVRTVEWVESFYPNGADRAEQIRFFLEDCYQNWGTLWVLLAGDTDVIPTRYATTIVQTTPDDPSLIPTDLYYACLEGNWNADKDDRLGEGWVSIEDPGDAVDLYPDLYVGRVPVSTQQQAADYVQKLLDYERLAPADANYPASALFLAEDLGTLHGADIAEEAYAQLHPWMKAVRLYEDSENYPGSEELTLEAAVDSIDTGFGWVHHVGHGYRNTMSVATGSISNPDADGLTNGDRQSFVFAINCSSASIDFNAIGEHWLKNPDGGAVGYIGTTLLAFPGVSERYQNEFYRLAFADSVGTAGECLFMCRLPWVAPSGAENFDRWTQLALILLGDPALPLWTHRPTPLDASHATQLTLGQGSFTVTALNQVADPVPDARVTLWALAHDYKTGLTDLNGEVTLAFEPESLGTFQTTVTRRNFLPYESSVETVSPVEPFVYIQGVSVADTGGQAIGNGDGQVDGGETVEVTIGIRNSGGGGATGITAELVAETGAEHLEILSGPVAYPDLDPGGAGQGVHLVHILPTAPHGFQPRFRIDVTASQGTWSDLFVQPVYTVAIEQYGHQWLDPVPGGNGDGVIDPGEAIEYSVELVNYGVGQAVDVGGMLRVLDRTTLEPAPLVTVTDSTHAYGDLASGERASGDYAFNLDAAADPDQLLLELTIADSWAERAVQYSDLTPPGGVDSLRAIGSDVAITIKWAGAGDDDLYGYDILRAVDAAGPFERINQKTVVGITFFEDFGLPPLQRYYYRIAARDSSFNQGVPSDVIEASTNPPLHPGWPIEFGQSTTSGVKCIDLDGAAGLELVVGADCIYAWHADGTEVVDGDNDPRTSGVFTVDGCDELNGFRADAAVADLDLDGEDEIIMTGWGLAAGVGGLYVLGPDGTERPGWPRTFYRSFCFASPAIGQLTPDPEYEIVTMQGENGIVMAYHHDGTEIHNGDLNGGTIGPYYLTGTSFLFSSPALGDLDGDGLDEIVFGLNSHQGPVLVLDPQGDEAVEILPGWPFITNGQITASPALADLDEDGTLEVIVSSECDSVFVLRADGTRFPGWPQHAEVLTQYGRSPSPVVVDLDQDGVLDVIVVGNDGKVNVWNRDGAVLPGWENVLIAQSALSNFVSEATPTVGDIDGDLEYEVLIGAEDGRLYGLNHDGTPVQGFPIAFEGEVRGSAAITDLDEDGQVEIALAGWDQKLYVWDMPSVHDPSRVPWPYFRRDLMNRGNPEPPLVIGVSEEARAPVPTVFRLAPARPNPFNPRTELELEVPAEGGAGGVRLRIFDVGGRLVRTLVDGPLAPGRHRLTWDGRDDGGQRLVSGAYFLRASASGFEATRKILLIK
jgi:hypothetical protein